MDRSIAPEFVIPDEFTIQQAEKVVLSNDVICHYVHAGDQELIKVELQFYAGNQVDAGTFSSLFVAKLLPEGTARRTSEEIAEAIAFHGAYLDISSGNEKLIVSVYSLNKHLAQVLDVVFDLISEPKFGEAEFQRVLSTETQRLAVSQEKTSFLASQEFKQKLFPEHYYGLSLTEEKINKLSTEQLSRFFDEHLKGQKFELFLSGCVDNKVLKLMDEKVSSMKFNNEHKAYQTIVHPHTPGFYKLAKEGSMQASVRYGFQTIEKTHEDFCKLSFVNELLGGYFGSRLMSNIREEKGFTYGVGSYLTQLKHSSFFQVLTDVKAEHALQTVEEIQREIKILQTVKVGEEEIERVRNYLFGSLASSLNTPFDLMDKYKSVHFFGLGYDYFDAYLSEMKEINSEDILQMANKYLSTDPVIVTCG